MNSLTLTLCSKPVLTFSLLCYITIENPHSLSPLPHHLIDSPLNSLPAPLSPLLSFKISLLRVTSDLISKYSLLFSIQKLRIMIFACQSYCNTRENRLDEPLAQFLAQRRHLILLSFCPRGVWMLSKENTAEIIDAHAKKCANNVPPTVRPVVKFFIKVSYLLFLLNGRKTW